MHALSVAKAIDVSTVREGGGERENPRNGKPFSPWRQFRVLPAPEGILTDRELSGGSKLLWMLLAFYCRQSVRCWPSERTLARELGRSPAQVRRYAVELEAAGLILRTVRKGRNNLWTTIENHRTAVKKPPESSPTLRP